MLKIHQARISAFRLLVCVLIVHLSDVTRAFRIRRGRENFVYRCDKSADKKSFLATYKVAAEEYAARRRKEREGEHERRRSMWNAEDVSTLNAYTLPFQLKRIASSLLQGCQL